MADYKGKPTRLEHPVEEIYDRLVDLGRYGERLAALPEEQRRMIGDVRFTDDSIFITAQPVGEIQLKAVTRRRPEEIALEAVGSPVPMMMKILIDRDAAAPDTAGTVTPVVSVDLPMMLKPLVGPKLQESADKFGDLLTKLFND